MRVQPLLDCSANPAHAQLPLVMVSATKHHPYVKDRRIDLAPTIAVIALKNAASRIYCACRSERCDARS